ncbi:prohibitin family protein [Oceanivirga salmonicida]|uniref:prohibitin family protein n=1 Tax=Oceanivirga salmonicida TaxID=1769291 RepID=UPI0012E31600|nr:prohibitin family protein [Oceanivirga salmonicida]
MNKEFKASDITKIFGVIISAIVLALIFLNVYTVDTGEVAIISNFGKVVKIEEAGLHFKIPFVQSKYIMETRERTYYFLKNSENNYGDLSMNVSTKDIQTINIEFTVQASINNPELLYKSFKGRHESRFIQPRVKEVVQATISKYTIEEFISKRIEISQIIFTELKKDFEKYGILVSNISIVNHDFSDEYENAIELKKVAEQAVERARAEQEKLSVEVENKIKLAEFNLKEKELQAKANLVESKSLTPQLLQKMMIEKWDGALPKVQGNSGNILSPEFLK